MTPGAVRSTIVTTLTWAALVLIVQIIYGAALVPLLPRAYAINLAPRPFGFQAEWNTEALVLIGWVVVAACAGLAAFATFALARGDVTGGLGAAFAVAVIAPVALTLQLSNAIVELTDGNTSIPVYLVVVALAAGLFSFFGRPRSGPTRRRTPTRAG